MNTDTWFKALNGVEPANGGKGRYPKVGRWTKHLDGTLEPREYGYHLAKGPQILDWLAPTLYTAEPCPDHDPVDGGDKWVTCRVRLIEKLPWDDRPARLFAADCAEAALLGERASGREPDGRSWEAVRVARLFAEGEASTEERGAAQAAAWYAAWYAARDAAWAAQAAAGAAQAAAWYAAWYAAWAAAWAAARAAAGAAQAAAWYAARDAAWDAAWAAARAAARYAEYDRLRSYLTGVDLPPVEPLYGETV